MSTRIYLTSQSGIPRVGSKCYFIFSLRFQLTSSSNKRRIGTILTRSIWHQIDTRFFSIVDKEKIDGNLNEDRKYHLDPTLGMPD